MVVMDTTILASSLISNG